MHALKIAWTAVFDEANWCDSACDRCPLYDRCTLGQSAARCLLELEKEDGHDALVADLTRDLNRALVMLEQACADEGIDPATIDPVPTPALAVQAEALGADLVRAAAELTEAAVRAGGAQEAIASRLVGNTTLLAVKTTRVAWGLGLDQPDPRDLLDPIILLIERTSAQLRGDCRLLAPFVPALLAARFAAAHGAMVDLVTPWIAEVSAQARVALRERIEEGTAPSPFCIRGVVREVS